MSENYILQGDSRNLHTYITKRQIDCIITDPPYGMKFESNMSTTVAGKALAEAIENDGDLATALQLFVDVMWPLMPKLADDADVYVCTRWDLMDPWKRTMESLGLSVPMQLIWNKGDPGMGDLEGCWGCGYEVILYGKKGRRPVRYRRAATINIDKVPPQHMVHPTEKPVALFEKFLDMSTMAGDFVVDPFSGSGASSVACQKMSRDSLAMDLKEKYVKIGNDRLAQQGFDFGDAAAS